MNDSSLKIIYNEDCIDLRNKSSENAVNCSNSRLRGSDNSISKISSKRLRKNARNYEEQSSLKSRSEFISPNSSPMIPLMQNGSSKKIELYKNKFTMTKPKPKKDKKNFEKLSSIKDDSLARLIENLDEERSKTTVNPVWKDQRLSEKYSLLKLPWRRSRTFPLFSTASTVVKDCPADNSDKKTYLYDEGSEVDSTYMERKRIIRTSNIFRSQLTALLHLSVYACALLVISLIIWMLSGNKYVYKLLIPKPPEDPVKKYFKYLGGGVLHFVTSIFRLFATILAVPTQEIYHPPPDFNWPPPR